MTWERVTMSHWHTRIHKTHHGLDLREGTTFPLIVFSMINHVSYIQMSFCLGIPKLGIPKFPKLGLSAFWKAITSCVDLRLKWGFKQCCSSCWNISNDMWHTTWTHVFQGDSRLLMVRNQIGTLTFSPSFGHNLYFKYSNRSCELISNIYVSKAFQWHKNIFNPMNFDPWNTFLKIRESIETPPPKVGANLGVCEFIPSHSPTLLGVWNVTPRLPSRPTPLQALALVMSLKLESWHSPPLKEEFNVFINI